MEVTRIFGDVDGMTAAQFLERHAISEADWEKSGCNWGELQRIAADHLGQWGTLNDAAEFFGKTIQRFAGVHSVRWRVKDVEHLLKKIIRKSAEKRYEGVTVDNYFTIVTDLIGIRALHLFKEDWRQIHGDLRAKWEPLDGEQIAYIRDGDKPTSGLEEAGLEVKVHDAGYRSLHYVFEIKPTQRAIRAEVQVRTIFEEGWSEIDHTLRYPDFSENQMVLYCLQILNRMAGSADEMGGFVRGLTRTLEEQAAETAKAINERDDALNKRDDALAKLQATIAQMGELKESNVEFRRLAGAFEQQVKELRDREMAFAAPDISKLVQLYPTVAKSVEDWPYMVAHDPLVKSGLFRSPGGAALTIDQLGRISPLASEKPVKGALWGDALKVPAIKKDDPV